MNTSSFDYWFYVFTMVLKGDCFFLEGRKSVFCQSGLFSQSIFLYFPIKGC